MLERGQRLTSLLSSFLISSWLLVLYPTGRHVMLCFVVKRGLSQGLPFDVRWHYRPGITVDITSSTLNAEIPTGHLYHAYLPPNHRLKYSSSLCFRGRPVSNVSTDTPHPRSRVLLLYPSANTLHISYPVCRRLYVPHHFPLAYDNVRQYSPGCPSLVTNCYAVYFFIVCQTRFCASSPFSRWCWYPPGCPGHYPYIVFVLFLRVCPSVPHTRLRLGFPPNTPALCCSNRATLSVHDYCPF